MIIDEFDTLVEVDTLADVTALADVELFLSDMDEDSTSKMCHQATVWLALQIKKNGIPDYAIHMCTGTYNGLDHSWLLVEDTETGEYNIVDMTLDQFIECDVPYVGAMDSYYHIESNICLCDDAQAIRDFVEGLGV